MSGYLHTLYSIFGLLSYCVFIYMYIFKKLRYLRTVCYNLLKWYYSMSEVSNIYM